MVINEWAIQRDPSLLDGLEDFVPERFQNTRVDFKGQHVQFIPSASGRRGCAGITFGVAATEYVIANLLTGNCLIMVI